jgi:hypothetical protein
VSHHTHTDSVTREGHQVSGVIEAHITRTGRCLWASATLHDSAYLGDCSCTLHRHAQGCYCRKCSICNLKSL